jgi:S-adenosylmethionine-diacylglycerol 3-amino-3-carboxypropyl transferase
MNTKIINYSQCWEDPDILLEALRIRSDDIVLSITSGGDSTLALLIANPKKIFTIDKNSAQNYLLELKIAAARALPYDKYLEFLGATQSKRRLVLFEKVRHRLSSNASLWWSAQTSLLKMGPVHCGRFERFTALFARYILPFIHSQKTIMELQSFNDLEKQRIFIHKKWDSKIWRFFFRLASSRLMLKRYARQKGMFTYAEEETVADVYRKRLDRHLTSVPIKGNFFLHYSLTGKYGDILPPYLEKKGYARLRTIPDSVLSISTNNLLNYLQSQPADTFSKFNLSDIFEALSPTENEILWAQIIRTAKSGAVVSHWNNLVQRSYPAHLSSKIKADDESVNRLSAKDKVFFYDSFHVYTIDK